MEHKKYGNVRDIWARTGGKCHLCHRPVDLSTYGLVEIYGAEAASVDHLVPQSLGGDHGFENLRIAHVGCNSRRGTQDPVDARFSQSGRTWEPFSTGARVGVVLTSTLGLGLVGALAGAAVAKPTPDKAGMGRAKNGAILGGACLGFLALVVSLIATE